MNERQRHSGMDTALTASERSAFQALTPKRQLFVQNYLSNGFNGSRAARDAGYSRASTDQEAYRRYG